MLNRKSLFAAILIGLFSIWGSAFAVDGEYKTPTQEDNVALLDSGIAHLEEALASAKAGDADAATAHGKESKAALVEINSETWAGPLEGAKSRVRVGTAKAKKGDLENAIKLWEQALPKLKGLYEHSNKTHDSAF